MTARRFCRYELRTSNMDAARAFYTDLLGEGFWSSGITLAPLPARAAARGAPPHWLGVVATNDPEATAGAFAARGGIRLGPSQESPDGASVATLRDPFGAVVGVGSGIAVPKHVPVAWHLLHTQDAEGAFAFYAKLFGWTGTEVLDLADDLGQHRLFSVDGSGESIGSIANTARVPGVHPHWQFYFVVDDLDAALERVRAAGGKTVGSTHDMKGARLAACEDPQGAELGVWQHPIL